MGEGAIARRPVATYSIVAREASGALGVAVQSHWFNVGAVVPWVERGVGAVAVQSISDPSAGARGLELLRSGVGADAALATVLQGDAERAYRQIGIVDADGGAAAHTGELCIAEAGHVVGDGFTAQANLMDRPTVWPAMADAFARAEGDLAERLLTALEGAEAEGGDVRGRQSAALIVLPPEGQAEPGVDLRVEDARDPLVELRGLVQLHRAYAVLNRGDAMMAAGDLDAALAAYDAATRLVPDAATDGEAAFWAGVALAGNGRVEDAIPYLTRAAAFGHRWAELLPRLVRSRMFPQDDGLLERALTALRSGDR